MTHDWLPTQWHWDSQKDPNLSFLEQNINDEDIPIVLIYLSSLLSHPLHSSAHLKIVNWIENHFHPICLDEQINTRDYYFGLITQHQHELNTWFKVMMQHQPTIAYHFFEQWLELFIQQKINIQDLEEIEPLLQYSDEKIHNDFIVFIKAILQKYHKRVAINQTDFYQHELSAIGESILQYLNGVYPDIFDSENYEINPMLLSLILMNSSPKDIEFIEKTKKYRYWKLKKDSKNKNKQ